MRDDSIEWDAPVTSVGRVTAAAWHGRVGSAWRGRSPCSRVMTRQIWQHKRGRTSLAWKDRSTVAWQDRLAWQDGDSSSSTGQLVRMSVAWTQNDNSVTAAGEINSYLTVEWHPGRDRITLDSSMMVAWLHCKSSMTATGKSGWRCERQERRQHGKQWQYDQAWQTEWQ